MTIRFAAPLLSLALAAIALPGSAQAQANVMKQCGEEYQAAKSANTLGGKNWNEYLKDCRVRHAGDKAAAPPAASAAKPSAAAAPAAPSGPAVYPTKVDPKYSAEKPAKQRMHTCVDQYKANKASGANGGLKWIQKGGGYYSECNKRLKG